MSNEEKICSLFKERSYSGGIFTGNDPLNFVFPVLLLQGSLIFLISSVIHCVLTPLKQPKIISDVLGGIILGPSLLGHNEAFREKIFPAKEMMIIGTISRIGILYFVFLTTVKMDKGMMVSTVKRIWNIGLTGFIVPFTITICMTHLLRNHIPGASEESFILLLSSNMSLSYFAVVAPALNELKLINSEVGQLALSCALIKDIIGWVILAFSSVISKQAGPSKGILEGKFSLLVLILFAIFVLRPAIRWIIRTTPEGKPVKQIYIVAILLGPLIMGILCETFDRSFMPGAIIMGLVVPAGPPLGSAVVEKCEVVNTNVFIPYMIVRIARYTDIYSITDWKSFASLNLIIISSYLGKTIGTVLGMFFFKSGFQTAILISLILNVKGIVDFIVALRWRSIHKSIDDQFLTTLVLSHTVLTAIITPVISICYKPPISLLESTHKNQTHLRTLQTTPLDSELRILCGIHFEDNVHSFITLLKALNTRTSSPICAYIVHLVELIGRSAPILLPYNINKKRLVTNSTDRMMRAVIKYSKTSGVPVAIQPFTLISTYDTMHENLCKLAQDKLIPLVVIPFHESQESCGRLTSLHNFNLNMQTYSPCTVGILVERGLTRSLNSTHFSYNVAVFFLGGPDDREAIALATRMSGHPDVSVILFRIFLVDYNQQENEIDRSLDERVLNEFMAGNLGNACVACREMVAENTRQLVDSIRSADSNYDLVIVGKRRAPKSKLEKELLPWVEHKELGVIGDMIVSADFCWGMMSVLVILSFGELDGGSVRSCTDKTSEASYFSSS